MNWIKSVFRWIWRALDVLRKGVHLVLMLFVLLVLLALISPAPVIVPQSAALVIDPSGRLVEQLAGSPVDRAMAEAQGQSEAQTLVQDLVRALERAGDDDRIQAVVLSLNSLGGGDITKLGQVSDAIERFRETGKPVIAAGDGYAQSQYYLAAGADEIYMHPLGDIFFRGFGFYRMYFREAIDKLSLDWHVFRVGDFKSAYDPYIRDDMSEAEKAEGRVFLDQLWGAYRGHVAGRRGLDAQDVQRYADDYLSLLEQFDGDAGQVALEAGLVDGLLTRDQVRDRVIEIVGEEEDGKGYSKIRFREYLAATDPVTTGTETGPQVALIVAAGPIVGGEQPSGVVGDETLSRLIREARDDEDIKALVLRVDSPGGGQFASDLIHRELELFRETGKPLVVSMGGMAASGGYILSLPGDEIWAHPETITGSIGVVAMFPTWDRALARLGMRVDGIGTTRYSGDFNPSRGISDEAKEIIQISAESGYEHFVGQVSEARDIDIETVRRSAGGRVWTGRDALGLGLVDRLGNREAAVERAAELAGLAEGDYTLRTIERELTLDEALALRFLASMVRWGGDLELFGTADPISRFMSRIGEELSGFFPGEDPSGLYYHCLCSIE